jgi:predicted metal-binding membrane protein
VEAATASPHSGARLDRGRLGLLGALLALTVVAWLVTNERMGGMESMPGMDLGALGFFVTVWVVMMVAMMVPAVAPTALAYDRLRESHGARGKGAAADATPLFVVGYLVVWALAGLAAYALYELVRAIDPAFLVWDQAGRYVAGGVIAAAAIYQVTALKRTSLARCRAP